MRSRLTSSVSSCRPGACWRSEPPRPAALVLPWAPRLIGLRAGPTEPPPSEPVSRRSIAPVGRSVSSAEALQDHGHALTATHAHRLQTELLVPRLQPVDQRGG